MLENVQKALAKYFDDVQKADTAKANAINDLNKGFEVKGKRGYYVPDTVKKADVYARQYNEILAEYEDTVAAAKKIAKADAEAALLKASADILIFSQKAPSDDILNSIKALETMGAKNITKEEVLMLMENCRNYLACKALASIANKAGIDICLVTLVDCDDIIKRVSKEVEDYFTFFNPLSYRTVALVKGDINMIARADAVLDDFMNGYFTKTDNGILETFSDLKNKSAEAIKKKAAEKKAKEAELEKMYNNMSEAEKLALYLH